MSSRRQGSGDRGIQPCVDGGPEFSRATEGMVKSHLELVVLAYLVERPRTGRELMSAIEKDLGIKLSPGRVYPLLHGLRKRGLLEDSREDREVVYRPWDRGRVAGDVSTTLAECERVIGFIRARIHNGPRP